MLFLTNVALWAVYQKLDELVSYVIGVRNADFVCLGGSALPSTISIK